MIVIDVDENTKHPASRWYFHQIFNISQLDEGYS